MVLAVVLALVVVLATVGWHRAGLAERGERARERVAQALADLMRPW